MLNEGSVTNFNPADYLKILFRRKWLLIAPIFLGAVISIVLCFLLPPAYESAAVILVEEEKMINPLIQGLAVSTTAMQRMRNIKEQLLGWVSLVELTKRLDMLKNVKTQAQFEGLILGLRRNIAVQMRGTNIIKISYFGKSPEQTQAVAKTLTDVLVDENVRSQTQEAELAITFIKEQLDVYKRKIKETEIANMEEQLKALLLDSTEAHPLVKELRQKITAAKKQLDSGEFKVATAQDGSNPTYQALKQELDKLTGQELGAATAAASPSNEPYDPNTGIYKLMLMDKLDSVMARDKQVNENIYNMLLQKLETAKITQRLEASKQGTRYTIIDPPRLPLKPSKPNKLLVIFLGLFFGAGAGVGLVLGREFMDHSFLDIEDAKENLELPVLGAISRLTTQEEIEKEKYKKKRMVTIASVSSVTLIVIVMLISFFRR